MHTRATFLRWGAAAAIGAAASPVAARAALPVPAPIGDDVGYLTFVAIAERAALVYYRECRKMKGVWSASERGSLRRGGQVKIDHVQRLTTVLGANAPSAVDFTIELPSTAFRTRRGALSLGRNIEGLLVGVYVEAVAFTADPATRLLLGRLLAADVAQRAELTRLAGLGASFGLPDPIDLQTAGDQLDGVLQATGYPTQ
jgi:hypothetical protein